MIVAAWILLVCFGFFTLVSFRKLLKTSLNWFHGIMFFVAIIIVALSAGVIWGGLFS